MSQYQVRQLDPMRQRLLLAGLVLLLLAVAFGCYKLGLYRSGYDFQSLEGRLELLNQQLRDSRAHAQTLLDENSLLQRSAEMDAAALLAVKENMALLQEDMVGLKEELVFYQSLLSPAERKPGLYVQSLELRPSEAGGFDYTLVLTQVRQNDRFAAGQVLLGLPAAPVDMSNEGEEEQMLELGAKLDEQAFKFKFFQRIEGHLLLPEGSQAEQLVVKIQPNGRRLKAVDEVFGWNDLTRGSN